ncbi:peptidoglycan DD-metalloendopeptidase family protein [Aurantimonas aggregata]|uniref:Peptidoglycan DD-metalloendopeptidase family protein n=1 Tax=Aurantimonas aggregata TaxID=2047720 RepID=A0A6L9ML82_9HYPH|nr:M23 family metallopeptidase [Aurantimonas aggregata]NDV88644.1 peptidoglycan DD-metalloendopeptidase family protein [Aurantimonas aggregata]
MAAARHDRTFGAFRQAHTVIIARGDEVRHFTITPRRLAVGVALAATLAVAAVATPTWYMLQSQKSAPAVDARMSLQREYEQRIAALRTQVDSLTSRHALSQRLVETKVDVLLGQQEELAARYDRLLPLFNRAEASGLIAKPVPLPTAKPALAEEPELSADIVPATDNGGRAGSLGGNVDQDLRTGSITTDERPANGHVADATLREIGRAIDMVEFHQIAELQRLADSARVRTVKIATALKTAGIALGDSAPEAATGGPFEPVPAGFDFDATVSELDTALTALQAVGSLAASLPLTPPMAHRYVSSTYGVRPDPFLGRTALHAGVDYALPQGTPVTASAPGKIVRAGRAGGYGNMVEIDHDRGITTRYGHLSRISVRVGQEIAKGAPIGAVGSTGRSTGPHLHYEIRRGGNAVDPERFFRIGDRIGTVS